MDEEMLTVEVDRSHSESIVRVRLADIQRLDVWRGTRYSRSRGDAVGRGVGVGGLVGAALLGVLAASFDPAEGGGTADGIVTAVAIGGVLGGALGAMGGLVVGGSGPLVPKDVWERIPVRRQNLQLAIAPAPHHGVRVGVSVGF